jgi:predicted GNAT family N-acyltransferase
LVAGTWADLREDACAVRFPVFVAEQRVPADIELDEMDPLSLHVVAYDAPGAPLATGRLLPDAHIGRMAVHARARGHGLGSRVLLALIEHARAAGHREVILHAQTHAIGFYRRHGFVAEGEEFMDAGIPHVVMRLHL